MATKLLSRNDKLLYRTMASGSKKYLKPWTDYYTVILDNIPESIEDVYGNGCIHGVDIDTFDRARVSTYKYVLKWPGKVELTSLDWPNWVPGGYVWDQNVYQAHATLMDLSTLDTSKVTNCKRLFFLCSQLTDVPYFNTSNVTDMSQMFLCCKSLIKFPELDTSNVTDMTEMFSECLSMVTAPYMNTSKVTSMMNMFVSCDKLTTIPNYDVSSVTNFYDIFRGCTAITSIGMTGISSSIVISPTAMGHDAIVSFMNNLATVSGQTLTMGSDKLALLSDDEKAIATGKGWTLA